MAPRTAKEEPPKPKTVFYSENLTAILAENLKRAQHFSAPAVVKKPLAESCKNVVTTLRERLAAQLAKKAARAEERKKYPEIYPEDASDDDDDFDEEANNQNALKDEQFNREIREVMQEGEQLETVRKDRVFEEDITQEEMDIIQQRVLLQQRQFETFQRREFLRKSRKIRKVFPHLTDDELREALKEFNDDVNNVILNFTGTEYLSKIRKLIAAKFDSANKNAQLTTEQKEAYDRLVQRRAKVLKKSSTEEYRKRSVGYLRLRLDDALKQLESGTTDPDKDPFEGWSVARVKAWKQIDTNPNTYYYRFNAPGESQRNGPWTQEERKLFFQRLDELGANGQWGIFSMTIPGRVGYQCSNFYRLLIKNKEVIDPNYIIDAKGKIHYLFGKKEGGEGVIRKHSKHTYGGGGRRGRKKGSDDEEDDEDDYETAVTTAPKATSSSSSRRSRTNAATASTDASTTATTTTTSSSSTGAKRKRKSRRPAYGRLDVSDGMEDDEDDEEYGAGRRKKPSWANSTRRTRAKIEADAMSSTTGAQPTDSQNSQSQDASQQQQPSQSENFAGDYMDNEDEMIGVAAVKTFAAQQNPLPGFVDPITLEEVEMPAISPYGHVMGYDTWLRCLTCDNPRNTCPITKKPLSRRQLVILTVDNIEEYRDKIVNF